MSHRQDTSQLNDRYVVVLVHGTFSSSVDDSGNRWWQKGSAFSRFLESVPARSVERFRWSGANSERHRREASEHLLHEWLLKLERRNVPYHLIGHSHGGNVILHALRLATESGNHLTKLRTWTTVGTPFITMRISFLGNLVRSLGRAFGLMVVTLLYMIVLPSTIVGTGLFLFRLFNLPSPNLELSPTVFRIVFLYGPAALLAIVGVLGFLASVLEASEVRRNRICLQRFADRWLAIWSPYDEAMGSLIEVCLRRSIVPQLTRRKDDPLETANKERLLERDRRISRADLSRDTVQALWNGLLWYISLVKRLLEWIKFQMVGAMVWPLAQAITSVWIRKTAVGADLFPFKIQCVALAPIVDRSARPDLSGPSPLPADVSERLARRASTSFVTRLKSAREYLATHLTTRRNALDWNALTAQPFLVHNLYFDDDFIRAALEHHLSRATNEHSSTTVTDEVKKYYEQSVKWAHGYCNADNVADSPNCEQSRRERDHARLNFRDRNWEAP